MSDEGRKLAQTWGRVGGLTAWARNDAETMVGPAHQGFRRRFERLVDPDRLLDERERSVRADRARRAHMLTLAAKSAAARSRKKTGPGANPSRPTADAPMVAAADISEKAADERPDPQEVRLPRRRPAA